MRTEAIDLPARRAGIARPLFYGAVVLLVLVVHLPSLQNGFVDWDDTGYVVQNTAIRSLDLNLLEWSFLHFQHANWHPLTWLSHALDYRIFGGDPRGHHLTSVILHCLNTLLVMVLVAMLMDAAYSEGRERGTEGRAALIAPVLTGLFFGVHPLHVESIAWASERKDLLSAFFTLLTVIAYIGYARRRRKGTPAAAAYAVTFILFALALLSKPMAVTVPLVLLLLDWFPLGRIGSPKDLRSLLVEKLPFLLMSGAIAVVAVFAQQAFHAVTPVAKTPLEQRFAVVLISTVLYLAKSVLPLGLIPFYPYPSDASLLSFPAITAVLAIGGLTAFCIVLLKRTRLYLGLLLIFIVLLLPVLGFVKVGGQAMADRYMYLAVLCPMVCVSLGLLRLWERGRAGFIAAAAGAILLSALYSVITVRQIGYWKDDVALWSRVIEVRPGEVAIAYQNRGIAYGKRGELSLDIADQNEAIRLRPANPESYYNRGNALARSGRLKEALQDYDRAISLSDHPNPDYVRNRNIVLKAAKEIAGAGTRN